MDNEIMNEVFQRLLNLKAEYEDKLKFAEESNDQEKTKHYKGACEGLTVAITAFAPYAFQE